MVNEEEIRLNTPESDVVLPPQRDCSCDGSCEDATVPPETMGGEKCGVCSYFTTIINSVSIAHSYHLKTHRHRDHVALQEYYEDMPDAIDSLVELYQGVYGVVETGCCELSDEDMSEVDYFRALRSYVIVGRTNFIHEEDTEMWSAVDDILAIIDTLLYKLTAFNECVIKTFEEFCFEDLK